MRRAFESWLYETSPLGFWPTTLLVFAIALGSFLAVAFATGPGLILETTARGPALATPAWFALVLCLILAAGLAFIRLSQTALLRERAALSEVLLLPEGDLERLAQEARAANIADLIAFWIGAALGIGVAILMIDDSLAVLFASRAIWFTLITPLTLGLLARGVTESVRRERLAHKRLLPAFRYDPLEPDGAYVFGRLAIRSALVWLVMAAIISLLFIRAPNNIVSWVTVGVAIAGSLGSMASLIVPARRAIRKAKEAELDRIRTRIREVREGAFAGDPEAAQVLSGLSAYERVVAESPDWPLSAPGALRALVLITIPIVPWFGSALADRLIIGLTS